MNANEYQRRAAKFLPPFEPLTDAPRDERDAALKVTLCAVGIAGESGEVYGVAMDYGMATFGLRASRMTVHEFPDEIRAKLVKELGDVMWYSVVMAMLFKVDAALVLSIPFAVEQLSASLSPTGDIRTAVITLSAEMMYESLKLLDAVKKMAFHRHGVDSHRIIAGVRQVVQDVQIICHRTGISLEEVMERNITKLEARYPEGFTPEGSLNKNESQE